jgi:DNA-binding protein HU-beta
MNKGDLVSKAAATGGISKAQVSNVLDSITEALKKALSDGESVTIKGFGTFSVKNRPARKGRNPRTGETIDIAAKRVVAFKPSSTLQTLL